MSDEFKSKVFILGISGFLGYRLANALHSDFLVSGACFNNFFPIDGAQIYPIDLTHPELLEAVIRAQAPQYIVNCMGMADEAAIEKQPKLAESLNVLTPVSVAILAAKLKAQFIQVGCAEAFDGKNGDYREETTDFTMAIEFGKQKLAAESYIRTQTMESTILRVGKVRGFGHPFRINELDRLHNSLRAKKEIILPGKRMHSFLSVSNFIKAITLILKGQFPGKHRFFHLGGPKFSEYDFACSWAKLNGFDAKLVKKMSEESDQRNTTMVSDNFQKNFPLWKAEDKKTLFKNLAEESCPTGLSKKLQRTLQTL
jgi:dTDP-4-dehydrorhamnose reductase